MWKDPKFFSIFKEDVNINAVPDRILLFTTEVLLRQLAMSGKVSQDGTHRVATKYYEQLFVTMVKVGDKWIPAVKALLPYHSKKSCRIQNEMIRYAIKKGGLILRMTSIMSDFEVAIQTAAMEAFNGVEMRGCRFHYGQAVFRHAEREFGKTLKSSKKFAQLVRYCLALPIVLQDELQSVIDEIK